MACSPLLRNVDDPEKMLQVVSKTPVLLCSEPAETFKPLKELGWVTYQGGSWCITDRGRDRLSETTDEPQSISEFFNL